MLGSNMPCWAQIVTTRAHTARTNEPHTPISLHLVSSICYQTHTHITHQHHTTHKVGGKEFEWTAMLRPLDFFPPGFVDLPRHANTHTHTRKCTVADMCNGELCLQRCDRRRVLSAIAAPTSPHDRGWWLTWDFCHCYGTARFSEIAPPSLLLAECSTSQRYFALSLVALALLFVISCLGPSHDRECFPPCPSPHSHRPCPGPFRGEGPRPCACMSLSLIHESGPHARAFIPDSRQFKASGLLLDKLPT